MTIFNNYPVTYQIDQRVKYSDKASVEDIKNGVKDKWVPSDISSLFLLSSIRFRIFTSSGFMKFPSELKGNKAFVFGCGGGGGGASGLTEDGTGEGSTAYHDCYSGGGGGGAGASAFVINVDPNVNYSITIGAGGIGTGNKGGDTTINTKDGVIILGYGGEGGKIGTRSSSTSAYTQGKGGAGGTIDTSQTGYLYGKNGGAGGNGGIYWDSNSHANYKGNIININIPTPGGDGILGKCLIKSVNDVNYLTTINTIQKGGIWSYARFRIGGAGGGSIGNGGIKSITDSRGWSIQNVTPGFGAGGAGGGYAITGDTSDAWDGATKGQKGGNGIVIVVYEVL